MTSAIRKDLIARRRALLGKIDRRQGAVLRAQSDIRDYRGELGRIEDGLRDLGWKPKWTLRP